MPITTYLNDHELNKPTSSKVINELLKEIRDATGDDWQIIETEYIDKGWFFNTERKCYSLYCKIGYEWQLINFCPEDEENSIYTYVDGKTIKNFMLGFLAGIEERNV